MFGVRARSIPPGTPRALALAVWCAPMVTTWPSPLVAQPRAHVTAPQGAVPNGQRRGDAVLLLVRPRVGDTLRLQVEQTVAIRGRRVDGERSSVPPLLPDTRGGTPAPAYGPRADRTNTRVTRVQLFAHSLVEASDLSSSTLLATTDSIVMWTGMARETPRPVRMPLGDEARQVRVAVLPNGAMRMSDPPPSAIPLGVTLASMPGLLPDEPVTVGRTWQRDMTLPSLPVHAYRVDGVVQVRLRFDSLSGGGRQAWISLTGVLRRDGAARELPAGTRLVSAGTIRGTLTVDRTRAWITDARTVMELQSEVASGPTGSGRPMRLEVRIVQRMRVR